MQQQRQEHEQVGYLSAWVRHKTGLDSCDQPVYDEWKTLAYKKRNLMTNVGKDYLHNQYWINNSAGGVGINFIALTESTLTPAAGDTTLGGEITTNGLQRVIASVRQHTTGSNTSTLSNTFTAAGSFTDVKASGLFNASSSGTMGHIANFTVGSGTLSSGDQVAVSWAMTAA